MSILRRAVERGELLVVPDVDVRLIGEQYLGKRFVAIGGCEVQRGPTQAVLCVNVRSPSQQEPGDGLVFLAGDEKEEGCEVLLCPLDASFLY